MAAKPSRVAEVGYHYTSWTNWLSIEETGLIPYTIHKPELQAYFPGKTIKGIWTWIDRPTGKSELGSLIFQVSTKMETKIVCLEIVYYRDTILQYKGGNVNLFHDGHVGTWMYHDREPAYVITEAIKPENISLVETFDLMDLVEAKHHVGV